jgi:hypothetical protein
MGDDRIWLSELISERVFAIGKVFMLTLKEQAEVCRIGLVIGLLSPQDVTRWADHIIEASDAPGYEIIEVSLLAASDLPACLMKLYEIKGGADARLVTNTILGLCAQRLQDEKLTTDETVAILDQLIPDESCRRCSIRAEYDFTLDAEIADWLRSLIQNPRFFSKLEGDLAPYAAYAEQLIFERDDL